MVENKSRADQVDDGKAPESPKRGVQYQHEFSFQAREMNPADWHSIGVENGKTVRWDARNNWTVPLSDMDFLSSSQVDGLLQADPAFSLVDSER